MGGDFDNLNSLELSASLPEEVRYMEYVYGMVSRFALLMNHPAFNRYRSLTDHNKALWNDVGALWEINLRPIGDELVCATSKLSDYDCPELWVERRPEGVLVELFFRRGKTAGNEEYFKSPWLKDPITGEAITHFGFCYESNVPKIGFWERLFRMGSIGLDSKNAEASVELALDTPSS